MRVAGLRGKRSAFITLATVVGLYACGSAATDNTTTNPGGGGTQTPAISIALSASTVNVTQGATTPITVTLTRSGGFTGDVTLAVDGLPTGATVAGATIASGQTSGTLTVTAGAAATVGTATITVRASGTGVTGTTATASLVLAASTPVQTASVAVSLAPTTVSVVQGASGTVTVNLTRTNFTGTVNLAVTGNSALLTPTLASASTTGNSVVLTLAAAATQAAGSQTLTITASGTGITNATASLPVTVTTATTGGGSTGAITWTFCARTGIPIWVAVQDGTGAFTRVTGTNDTYSFNITSGKGGVAYVFPAAGGGFDQEVFYGNTADITAQGTTQCTSAGAGKSVTANITNAASSDIVLANLSSSSGAVATGAASVAFTGVPNGNLDLIASKSTFVLNGSSITQTLSKILIRRGVNPATGSTLAALDFNSAEAFAPVTSNVTIGNLNGEVTIVNSLYTTTNSPYAVNFASDISPTSAATRTYSGVPAANQAAGDLHGLSIVAIPSLTSTTGASRQALLFFKDAVAKTVTLGPTLNNPVVTALTAVGYGRIRCAITVQAEYNKYFTCQGTQTATGANYRNAVVTQTSNYATTTTGAALNLDIPDLSAVSGFDVTWGLKVGVSTTWSVTATAFTGNVLPAGTQYTEGLSVLAGTKQGTVTP